ncbi:hypothetical protein QE152_g27730 [Popillia japonica]|uniref:Uncharacterized protein n=1 Tax=Popillia japonica TaxID=7064 RepID=A0AAW1JSY7_POPJA
MRVKEEKLPPEEEAVMEAEGRLLPQKSRLIYEREYQSFKKWKSTNKIADLASCKLINLMKNLSGGYKGKKSKILEADDIIKFLTQAPRDVYLFMKVITIFGVHGATRSDELHKLKVSDVDDRKSVIVTSLFDTKTKQDSKEEEASLVQYMKQSSKMAYGLSYVQIRKLAYEYVCKLNKETPAKWKKDQIASVDWLKLFMGRYHDLALRRPEKTSLGRATAFNRKDHLLEDVVSKNEEDDAQPGPSTEIHKSNDNEACTGCVSVEEIRLYPKAPPRNTEIHKSNDNEACTGCVSVEEIRLYPKAPPRKKPSRGIKKRATKILTDTGEKTILEEEQTQGTNSESFKNAEVK